MFVQSIGIGGYFPRYAGIVIAASGIRRIVGNGYFWCVGLLRFGVGKGEIGINKAHTHLACEVGIGLNGIGTSGLYSS